MSKKIDNMNKGEVLKIIETTLKAGDKTPGLFDLPKIMDIKAELRSCSSIDDVLGVIEKHRILISKAFGLSEEIIGATLEKIKALES
jgi:hypothetical protein